MRLHTAFATATVVVVLLPTAVGGPASADAVRDQQWYLGSLRIADANRVADGAGMTAAVLDTGVDASHPDLAGAVLAGIDAYSPARDGRVDDSPEQHGTGMATLIAGRGHGPGGADGIRGVAPKANILPATVWPPGSVGLMGGNVAYGIRWAVDNGADVVCISGGGSSDEEVGRSIEYAVSRGVPVVASIGNTDSVAASYPGSNLNVFGIGSVGPDGSHSPFSTADPAIDFVAPGSDLPAPRKGGGYTTVEGTSPSTAIACGIVLLARQKHPRLTTRQLYELLKGTAIDKGPPGHDYEYGWGIIDPVKALTAPAPGTSSAAPPPAPEDTGPAVAEKPFWRAQTFVGLAVLLLALAVLAAPFVLLVVFLRRRRLRRRPPEEATRAGPTGSPPAG